MNRARRDPNPRPALRYNPASIRKPSFPEPVSPPNESPFVVAIPARHAATRLPGKPLVEVCGRPLIAHVIERALESGAEEVVVATDDERIGRAAEAAGAGYCLTGTDCASGTDRLAQCAAKLAWPDDRIVVNLQGDEPLLPGRWLDEVAAALDDNPEAMVSTIAVHEPDAEAVFNPNVVKLVRDVRGFALYFSRAPVPWHRDTFAQRPGELPKEGAWLRHIGVYGYRVAELMRLAELDPTPAEQAESLEQLRVLENGGRIHVTVLDETPPPGVDTAEDLERVKQFLEWKAP